MAASALDHIVLVTSDVETTLAWYTRHAGLAPVNVDEWRSGRAPFPSLRVSEATIIDLLEGDPSTERGRLDHICLVVTDDDLTAVAAELDVVDRGPRSGARGIGESIYVRGPDDLLVEFRSYPPAS